MTDSRPSFLLVDGNNVIHAWQDLRDLYGRQRRSAYSELIKILESYQDFSHDRVVVVFDGRGERTIEEREAGSVQVFYSSSDTSADSIIERLAVRNADQYRIVVATNDVPVQDAVVAAGGEAISCDALSDRVDSSQREMHRWLEARRKS